MVETTPSLASGTFVLLARLFFVLAAKVPPAGLRKENGKMKVRYEFVNGEISEIEVDDNLMELLVDFDRQEYNNDHRGIRRSDRGADRYGRLGCRTGNLGK